MGMEIKGPSSNPFVERQIRRDEPSQTDKSRRIRPDKCAKKTRKRDWSGDGKKGQISKPKLCQTTLSSRSRRRAWKDECSGEEGKSGDGKKMSLGRLFCRMTIPLGHFALREVPLTEIVSKVAVIECVGEGLQRERRSLRCQCRRKLHKGLPEGLKAKRTKQQMEK